MKQRLFAALLAAVLIIAAGCDFAGAPKSTDKPGVDTPGTDAPGTDVPGTVVPGTVVPGTERTFTLETRTIFFPEGAGEADADYILTYTLPVFDADAEALTAALSLYEDELTERVRAERLPLADRVEGEAAPATTVHCETAFAGGYWNIRLFETVSFGTTSETLPFVLVLDDAGNEQDFSKVSGNYEPDALLPQQIFNAIDQTPAAYFGDLTPEDVRLVLDLQNGFATTDTGYELFIRPGALAPEEAGVLTFALPRAALYPNCVGEALSAAEYETLLPALGGIAAACAANYEGFLDGSPDAYLASAFLTHFFTTGNEATLWVEVPAETYEAAFAAHFTGKFPENIAQWGDGTTLEGDIYRVPVHPRAAYALRVDDAVRTQDTLVVYGMLLYGLPGTEEAGELASLVLTLLADSAAPLGFRFVSADFA